MSFLKNLKTKLRKKLKEPIFSYVQTIPEEDVGKLAIMCRMCRPVVLRRGILAHVYAYYVPQLDSDIDLAKEIFAKSGIQMSEHYSRICGDEGQTVLRVNYAFCDDNNKLVHEMKKIEDKYVYLYTPQGKSEKAKYYQQVHEMKQNKR